MFRFSKFKKKTTQKKIENSLFYKWTKITDAKKTEPIQL